MDAGSGEEGKMTIERQTKINIRKSIKRIREANLNTTAVLVACCYIDGLAQKLHLGKYETGFRSYIRQYMPKTFDLLRERSKSLEQKDDFCLHALWDQVRCGLVHEIDPKSRTVIVGRGKTSVHLNTNDERYRGKDLVLCSAKFVDDFMRSIDNI